jgi:uncharacterized LabA/DUF88 family protein
MCRIPRGKSIVIAGGFHDVEKVVRISCEMREDLVGYFSNQKEADTRMVLHAVGLKSKYKRTIIRTDDTKFLSS